MPLHPRSRLPQPDEKIIVQDQVSIDVALPPGHYLVVIDIPGFGFHEVFREVLSEARSRLLPNRNHISWSIDESGRVVWPPVNVLHRDSAVGDMVLIPDGEFEMGDGEPYTPKHTVSVESFYVDPTEVTVEEWESEFGEFRSYELPKGRFPVARITWDYAVAFAERTGRRLLTEQEFEFLASGLGTSECPSGTPDDYAIEAWGYEEAGKPEYDQLAGFPVYGLHSNVAEWTQSIQFFYPGVAIPPESYDRQFNLQQCRVTRGGPVTLGDNDRSLNTGPVSIRARPAWVISTRDSEIGVRCCRSQRPRFVSRLKP